LVPISSGGETVNDALIPPNGRREGGEAPENIGKFQTKIEREQAAERRTAHAGVRGARKHAVFLLNKRHHFLQEKFGVAVGAAAAQARRFGWRVFVNTHFSNVVNAHDDQRLHSAGKNEIVGGVADVPVHARNE
jgi:hypothetical protein